MTDKPTEAPPLDMGGGITPSSVGTLNLRPDVIDGFLAVRRKHGELQALLAQVMRRVALPTCKEIGDELLRIKGLYSAGKKGPGGHASRFYGDAKQLTGLSKPSVANYIQVAENWHRLMDFMCDPPEGASPITSLKGALEVIRAMNRPIKPAVDVEAVAVEGGVDQALSPAKGTRYAASTRERALPPIDALMNVAVLSEKRRDQLAQIREALLLLLDQIEADEAAAAAEAEAAPAAATVDVPTQQWVEPDAEPANAVTDVEAEPVSSKKKSVLPGLYPLSADGLEALERDIAEAGSGPRLAAKLDVSKQAVSAHRQRILKALDSATA